MRGSMSASGFYRAVRDYAHTEHDQGLDDCDDTADCRWCATHTCPSCSGCAHSHCFNCYQKGKAFWWMMSRMSGWSG